MSDFDFDQGYLYLTEYEEDTIWRHHARISLLKRDGSFCNLCCKELVTGTEPQSLDRIVPGAAGGKYNLSNVWLTHESCNNLRGPSRLDWIPYLQDADCSDICFKCEKRTSPDSFSKSYNRIIKMKTGEIRCYCVECLPVHGVIVRAMEPPTSLRGIIKYLHKENLKECPVCNQLISSVVSKNSKDSKNSRKVIIQIEGDEDSPHPSDFRILHKKCWKMIGKPKTRSRINISDVFPEEQKQEYLAKIKAAQERAGFVPTRDLENA